MKNIPERFRLELNEMDNLYGTIQDLRIFKNNIDKLLLNKCKRDSMGHIIDFFPWNSLSSKIYHELYLNSLNIGDTFYLDIADLFALTNSEHKIVDCGKIKHVPSKEEPFWSLHY